MYIVEGQKNENINNIPQAIYWAVVTLTTVGYGDIVPITTLGKTISVFIMILGYAIIAVPTGIVSAELSRNRKDKEQLKNQDTILEKEQEIISKETEILEKLKSLENKIENLNKKNRD